MTSVNFSNADIMTGDIVTLKDGKCGKVINRIEGGKYLMISGKRSETVSFYSDDVIKAERRPLRRVRVHQIVSENTEYIFRGYAYVKSKRRIAPPAELYRVVFDGSLETNNLEDIWSMLNTAHPSGYKGRSVSMSDIIELYDNKGSRYFYCDNIGFRKIRFKPVKFQYMLISCTERDILTPKFFPSLEAAQRRMKNEVLEQLESFDGYDSGNDYEIDKISAWANIRFNSDWQIIPLSVNGKQGIRVFYS